MSPRPRSLGEGAFRISTAIGWGSKCFITIGASPCSAATMAVLHLWEASDETWSERRSLEQPVRSGAESFIAGTASCRIAVEGVDALYEEMRESDVLHPVSKDAVETTAFGTREFATLDLDGNLVTFFQWTES